MRPLEIINEGKDSNDHWKRSDISSNPSNGLISLSAQEIGRGRNDESPRAQPRPKEIDGHNPVPNHMYRSFHALLPDHNYVSVFRARKKTIRFDSFGPTVLPGWILDLVPVKKLYSNIEAMSSYCTKFV